MPISKLLKEYVDLKYGKYFLVSNAQDSSKELEVIKNAVQSYRGPSSRGDYTKKAGELKKIVLLINEEIKKSNAKLNQLKKTNLAKLATNKLFNDLDVIDALDFNNVKSGKSYFVTGMSGEVSLRLGRGDSNDPAKNDPKKQAEAPSHNIVVTLGRNWNTCIVPFVNRVKEIKLSLDSLNLDDVGDLKVLESLSTDISIDEDGGVYYYIGDEGFALSVVKQRLLELLETISGFSNKVNSLEVEKVSLINKLYGEDVFEFKQLFSKAIGARVGEILSGTGDYGKGIVKFCEKVAQDINTIVKGYVFGDLKHGKSEGEPTKQEFSGSSGHIFETFETTPLGQTIPIVRNINDFTEGKSSFSEQDFETEVEVENAKFEKFFSNPQFRSWEREEEKHEKTIEEQEGLADEDQLSTLDTIEKLNSKQLEKLDQTKLEAKSLIDQIKSQFYSLRNPLKNAAEQAYKEYLDSQSVFPEELGLTNPLQSTTVSSKWPNAIPQASSYSPGRELNLQKANKSSEEARANFESKKQEFDSFENSYTKINLEAVKLLTTITQEVDAIIKQRKEIYGGTGGVSHIRSHADGFLNLKNLHRSHKQLEKELKAYKKHKVEIQSAKDLKDAQILKFKEERAKFPNRIKQENINDFIRYKNDIVNLIKSINKEIAAKAEELNKSEEHFDKIKEHLANVYQDDVAIYGNSIKKAVKLLKVKQESIVDSSIIKDKLNKLVEKLKQHEKILL